MPIVKHNCSDKNKYRSYVLDELVGLKSISSGEKGLISYTVRVKDWNLFFQRVFNIQENWIKQGVYLIDDVYVGQSSNVRERIKRHVISVLNNRHNNISLQSHISKKLIEGIKISVEFMSENNRDERKVFDMLSESGYKLFNVAKTIE